MAPRRRVIVSWSIAAVALLVLGAVSWGPIVSRVEQPEYRIVERADALEIRDYGPMIVAETETTGERERAIGNGFRLIADYIFGNNSSAEKVAMTAPVMQQGGEKIAMTAPVMQQGSDQAWQVRFVMPARYTMETLPRPRNPAVRLVEIPGKRFAVLRFSGLAGADNLQRHTEELQALLRARNLEARGTPVFAFYNPPWTLPFMRRNEVMVEIAG